MRLARLCTFTIYTYLCTSAPLPTSLFLSHNEALVPPYRVLVDTNFINLSLENRIDLVKAMMDALYAKGSCQATLRPPVPKLNLYPSVYLFQHSHPMYFRLCSSRVGKIRSTIPSSTSVGWHRTFLSPRTVS